MKKILALLMLSISFMFAAVNLQTASKEELMSIKGIGSKKADQIIKYRKTNKIKSADDLQNIKGFGSGIIANVKGNKKVSKTKMNSKKVGSGDRVKETKKLTKSKEKNKKAEVKKQTKKKIEKNRENKKAKKKPKS